jgi:DNA invertase Pin-like site-specific DNA recombinase
LPSASSGSFHVQRNRISDNGLSRARPVALQEPIDTSTPGGKLIFHVLAALAEFERDLIRERTAAELAAALARGRRRGGPGR